MKAYLYKQKDSYLLVIKSNDKVLSQRVYRTLSSAQDEIKAAKATLMN
jgi:hypothetical protein